AADPALDDDPGALHRAGADRHRRRPQLAADRPRLLAHLRPPHALPHPRLRGPGRAGRRVRDRRRGLPRAGDRPAGDPHRRPRLAHDAARAAAGGDGDHPPLLRPPGPQGSVRPRADGLPAGADSGLRLLNLPARLTLAGAATLLLLSPVAARADDRSYALAVEQAHSLVKEG